MIYPFKMVIFHSYANFYQKVVPIDISDDLCRLPRPPRRPVPVPQPRQPSLEDPRQHPRNSVIREIYWDLWYIVSMINLGFVVEFDSDSSWDMMMECHRTGYDLVNKEISWDLAESHREAIRYLGTWVCRTSGCLPQMMGSKMKYHMYCIYIYINMYIYTYTPILGTHPKLSYHRRKFRSQTSDNMDRWKSRGGKSQGGEEKTWEDQRRDRERRKKMKAREKVGKSRFTVFFQWFVALEGRKVGSLKQRVRSHLARWPDERRKIARRCGAKHISKSKCTKHTNLGPLLEVEMLKKRTLLWREAHFPSQNVQSTPCSDRFWKLRCRKSARRCGAKHISKSKVSKT